MKILVTGATGFIGRHVIPKLLACNHTVVAAARDEARVREFDWHASVTFVACDLHQPIAEPFRLFGSPDTVMHLAWPGLPNYMQPFHFEENLPADCRFLKSLIDGGLKHLLVAGTCLEYGMQNGCLKEDLPTRPATSYALAKDTLRKYLEFLIANRQFVLQWARLFYMHGPGQNPDSLFSQLDRALESNEKVFNMSRGEQLRDYLPVQEVASRLVTLANHPECKGIFNICSGQPTSIRSLVESHLEQRKAVMRLNLGHYPYPAYEPMAFWGCGDRFQSMLGVQK